MTTCPCCREKVPDISKRFDPVLGCICPDCWEFLLYAEIRLSRHGICGSVTGPIRFTPKSELP